MRFGDLPAIRVQIEHIQQTVLSYLDDYTDELSNAVNVEIKRALEDVDLRLLVYPVVHNAVEKAVKRYFEYGDGWHAIENAISDAFGNKKNE